MILPTGVLSEQLEPFSRMTAEILRSISAARPATFTALLNGVSQVPSPSYRQRLLDLRSLGVLTDDGNDGVVVDLTPLMELAGLGD